MVDPSVILGGLIGAIVWDLVTWWGGLPSSSSHALLGGLAGAAIAKAGFAALIPGGWTLPLLFILISPLLGMAVSLLFSIYLTKPSPFCLMDEVDAPLDDANVGRFTRLLDEFKSGTQFLVITHNPRTMQAADAVYGVTMQEPGVSTIVGVRLAEWEQAKLSQGGRA